MVAYLNCIGKCLVCGKLAFEEHHIIGRNSGFECEQWVKDLTIPTCLRCHNLYHNKINISDRYKKSISATKLVNELFK